jgi:hypothetical protein
MIALAQPMKVVPLNARTDRILPAPMVMELTSF